MKVSGVQVVPKAAPKRAIAWDPQFNCDHVDALRAGPDPVVRIEAEVDKVYPEELVNPAKVEHAEVQQDDLQRIVVYLSCASMTNGVTSSIPDGATALFASKRYGAKAFEILAQESHSPSKHAKDAKDFYSQMKSFVAGPKE